MGALKMKSAPQENDQGNEQEKAEKLRETESLKASIAVTLYDPEWRKFFSQKTIKVYEDYLAVQNGEALDDSKKTMGYVPQPDPPKYLRMTYEGMVKEGRLRMERFKPIQQALEAVVRDKVASQADINFLIEWVHNGDYNFDQTNAPKFATLIKEKIGRMKRDKKLYEELSQSEFSGAINITGKISLNDERSFLSATVNERRAFLKEAQNQIVKMEIKQAIEKKDAQALRALYIKRLIGRLCNQKGKGGCIGRVTFQAYTEELEKQDLEALEYWHKEFESQMKPREAFWSEVRSTLQDEGLRDMESLMNDLSLKEAKKEFAIIKADESGRLCNLYGNALLKYKGKLFGDHTDRAFRQWMAAQPLSVQYDAEAKLDQEMWPYKRLWKEVDLHLSESQQEAMRESLKDPNVGLTELQEQLEKYKSGDQEKDQEEAEHIRNQLDGSGKRALDSTLRVFEKLSQADQETFIQIINRANQGQTRSQFDMQARNEKNNEGGAGTTQMPMESTPPKSQQKPFEKSLPEEVDFQPGNDSYAKLEVSQDMPLNEAPQALEVTKIRSFEQMHDAEKGERRAKIMANDKESLEASIRAHRKVNFREEDQLLLTTDTGSGEQVADSRTVLSIEAYLKAKRKANQNK